MTQLPLLQINSKGGRFGRIVWCNSSVEIIRPGEARWGSVRWDPLWPYEPLQLWAAVQEIADRLAASFRAIQPTLAEAAKSFSALAEALPQRTLPNDR